MLAPIKIYFDYRKVLRRIDMFFCNNWQWIETYYKFWCEFLQVLISRNHVQSIVDIHWIIICLKIALEMVFI
jgi:hypothetical protein